MSRYRSKPGSFFLCLAPADAARPPASGCMIAGFELLTEGEISIRGQPMGDIPPYKRPVNTVFQNYALFPHMTIFENVAFVPRLRGISDKGQFIFS